MTEKAFPRQLFDPHKDFIVARDFPFNGRVYLTGAAFDKTGITDRRLRLLYEQRYLRMVDSVVVASMKPVVDKVPVPQPKGAYTSRRRLVHA